MPKSSSKRKKEKNADFKKTKLKVGKKKAVADSFTDTSFKSKGTYRNTKTKSGLTFSYSISHDKTALLTNSRNVTFAELMTQLKHYSPGTRKDALLGLRDLFHRHPHLLPLHLGVLVNSVVRLLIDDSAVVRKALQNFLGEFIPMLHARDIHPFLPLLIVYTCSAMTHILDDIREDALKFMDLWVAAGGQVVVNGFWDKIIPNYVSLLTSDSNATSSSKNASAMSFTASANSGMVGTSTPGNSGSSGVAQKVVANASTGKNAPGSLKAKCDVLESLAGFLQEGLGGEGGDKDPYWFLRNFLGTAHARKAFNTIRTQRGAHEDLSTGKSKSKSSKKRKASTSASNKNGRSVRKKTDSDDEEGSDSEDGSEDSDESDSEDNSSDSEMEEHAENSQSAESLLFDSSPIISFGNSHRHHQPLTTFPMHPSVSQSSLAQAIWGSMTRDTASGQQQQDPNARTSIAIRVFHQQGGASASGAGANTGVSGSGKTGDDQMGGVQGRLAQIKPLIATLHPLLLSVWLDTAPSVFSSATTIHANHALTVVHLVLRIWGILWRAALARPKKKTTPGEQTEEEREQEREEVRWLDEFLQGLLRHVLIYFPFGKDTVGMIDSKVSALLQEMNTTYCELTSLFLLGSGVGRTQLVRKESSASTPANSNDKKSKRHQAKADLKLKSSYRISNKDAKKRQAAAASANKEREDSSDYDSEDDDEEFAEHDRAVAAAGGKQDMVAVQVVTPPWADQVVEFVLDALGWTNPEGSDDDDDEEEEESKGSSALTEMSGMSTDFKSQHLVALLPTLWTLLNCLETKRREWVFEALMSFFDQAHVQSGSKRTVLQFLALVIKLQSHPHYTGSFSINVPGSRAGVSSNRKALLGLAKKDRKEQQASIQKMSKLLSASLLKLPKLLWDLGTERVETSQAVLDLLAWVTIIAGESSASMTLTEEEKKKVNTGAAMKEAERAQFLKTLQSYMALFFCVTVAAPKGSEAATRTIMGPFVKLPPALQRRAIEIVFYSGVVPPLEENRVKKTKKQQQVEPLLAAVQSCCKVGELSDETRLYIQETLRIN
ncbi:hypothetical protein EC991_005397 [Linnemannia zychae]|nr:hypothetical protein EC991_005397 [Linnemannia zychae]